MLKLSNGYKRGFIRVIDISGSMKTRIIVQDGFKRDRMAIEGDWMNVGKGIQREINKYNISENGCRILAATTSK